MIIEKEMGKEEVLDIMAGYILEEKINVHKIALDCNISIFRGPGQLRPFTKSKLPKHIDTTWKIYSGI